MLSEKEFTEAYLTKLSSIHPGAAFEVAGNMHIIMKLEDFTQNIYSSNAYNEYKLEPDDLDEVLTRFALSAINSHTNEPLDTTRIIPVIKDSGYIDEIAAQADGELPSLVYEYYNEKLIILYAEDTEYGISYFDRKKLEEAGIAEEELFGLATENLAGLLPEINRNGEDGLYMLVAGGNYEASLILFNNIWTPENMPVNGDIVITIPARDMLLVTGSNDEEGLQKIRDLSQKTMAEGSYTLLPDLFVWDGERFVSFEG